MNNSENKKECHCASEGSPVEECAPLNVFMLLQKGAEMFLCSRWRRIQECVCVYMLAMTQVWTGRCSSIAAVRLELLSRLVGAPSAAALNGKHRQPLAVRCRPDKLVLTDKAEQLWSTTEQRNTNAKMQP